MEKEFLEECLADGMSLNEIGELVGKPAGTVGYWVIKYGLTAVGPKRHAARGGLTREELEPLVREGLTLREIAEKLDRSNSTVRYWLKRHALPRPRDVRRSDIDAALQDGTRTIVRECRKHGFTKFAIENSGRVRCKKCRQDAVARWRRRTKDKLVAEAGGRCQLCGYDRCRAALEFHHLDPAEKEFELSMRGVTRAIDRLRVEAAKCALLCANCHAEVEVGFTALATD